MPGPATWVAHRLVGWRRRALVALAVVAGSLAVGAVLGLTLAGGSPSPSRSEELSVLTPLRTGVVVAAPSASPHRLDEPAGMGSLHAGLSLTALGTLDEVRTDDGRRRAPEGSRLVGFRLDDWTCEVPPCSEWRSLQPRVDLDGVDVELPAQGSSFVVVVPPGAESVSVVIDADGFVQSLSLLDGKAGPRNIVLLADRGTERRVPLGRRFRVVERTSIPLEDGSGGLVDQFEREVGVDYAQLRFFLHGATPSAPGKAFLVVNAYYSYRGRPAPSLLGPGEVVFVDSDGRRYDPRDLDPDPTNGLLGFEVPATLRSGTLVVGGTTDKVSTTGVPYVSSVQEVSLPLEMR